MEWILEFEQPNINQSCLRTARISSEPRETPIGLVPYKSLFLLINLKIIIQKILNK